MAGCELSDGTISGDSFMRPVNTDNADHINNSYHPDGSDFADFPDPGGNNNP